MKIRSITLDLTSTTVELIDGCLIISQGGKKSGDEKAAIYIEKLDLDEFLKTMNFIAARHSKETIL